MITFLISCAGAVLAAIACHEGKAWAPKIVDALINRAVRRVPQEISARMREEWTAHIAEVPGTVGKIAAAAGFLLAAKSLHEPVPLLDRVFAIIMVARFTTRLVIGEIRRARHHPRDFLFRIGRDLNLAGMMCVAFSPVITGRRRIQYALNMMDSITIIMTAIAGFLKEGRDPVTELEKLSLSIDPETGTLQGQPASQNPSSTPR